jgi:hypothetical protein
MNNKLKKPAKKLCKSLKEDNEYFNFWQANIAMQFVDEYAKALKDKKYGYLNQSDIHCIANDAAMNFLNLSIKK